mgnify:CR=1 FL=1
MTKYLAGFFSAIILCVGVVAGMLYFELAPESFYTIRPGMNLADISDSDREYYKSQYVTINAGSFRGSGCKYSDDKFLASLHVVWAADHDKVTIFANGTATKMVASSLSEQDFAVLSSNLKEEPSDMEFPIYNFREGEDVVAVGNSDTLPIMVQPAKIMNVAVRDLLGNYDPATKKVFTVYVGSGLSGGCIYPLGSRTPVALFRKKQPDEKSQVGFITQASRLMKAD